MGWKTTGKVEEFTIENVITTSLSPQGEYNCRTLSQIREVKELRRNEKKGYEWMKWTSYL